MAVTGILPAKKQNRKTPATESKPAPQPAVIPFKLLNTHEAAALLGLNPTTLGRWRMEKIGPNYLKMGGTRIRYRLDQLLAFAHAQAVTTAIKGD